MQILKKISGKIGAKADPNDKNRKNLFWGEVFLVIAVAAVLMPYLIKMFSALLAFILVLFTFGLALMDEGIARDMKGETMSEVMWIFYVIAAIAFVIAVVFMVRYWMGRKKAKEMSAEVKEKPVVSAKKMKKKADDAEDGELVEEDEDD